VPYAVISGTKPSIFDVSQPLGVVFLSHAGVASMPNPTELHAESSAVKEQLTPTDESASETGHGQPKKKQKRNKPTLSCFECVERKTKVRAMAREFPRAIRVV
jgi:hypothetical protein